MQIFKITDRNIVFRFSYPEWDLNLHLILGERRDFLIDTGVGKENVEPILNYRKERNRKQELIIVNTHYHFDHVWGNYLFPKHLILAHYRCPAMIKENFEDARREYPEFWKDEMKMQLPNLLIRDEIYFCEEGIRIFATSGHSPDGISVLDEIDGVLNVGDNIGDTMEQILPELECEKEEYKKVIERYQSLDFRHLVSGHNEITDKKVLDKILWELKKA